jgi:hypothetical protein
VGVFVGVAVGVFVGGTGVGVFVGVAVGVFVGVAVGVFVGVAVGVFVGVAVGVFVRVAVGVAVGSSTVIEPLFAVPTVLPPLIFPKETGGLPAKFNGITPTHELLAETPSRIVSNSPFGIVLANAV